MRGAGLEALVEGKGGGQAAECQAGLQAQGQTAGCGLVTGPGLSLLLRLRLHRCEKFPRTRFFNPAKIKEKVQFCPFYTRGRGHK